MARISVGDGLYYKESTVGARSDELEWIWIGRYQTHTRDKEGVIDETKNHEVVLGRKFRDGMTKNMAAVRLDEFKAGTAVTVTKQKKLLARESLDGCWEVFINSKGKKKGNTTKKIKDLSIFKSYKAAYDNHLKPILKDMTRLKPARLTLHDLDKLKEELADRECNGGKGLSGTSQYKVCALLKRICDANDITLDKRWKLPDQDDQEYQSLSDEQLRRYKKVLEDELDPTIKRAGGKNPDGALMCMIVFYCGCRAGDAYKLTWGCVDFSDNHYPTGSLLFNKTKTGKDNRVPMPPQIRTRLKARLKAMKTRPIGNTLVFPDPVHGKVRHSISHIAKRFTRYAGLPDDIRPSHAFRHQYVTRLLKPVEQGGLGYDVKTVQKLVGHADPAMTLRYLDSSNETKAKASTELGALYDQL